MSKFLCMMFIMLGLNSLTYAAPGDTTWVQSTNVNLTGYGSYDMAVLFPAVTPGVTYRKILMIFTLGKYMCPGYNPATAGTCSGCSGWCGDWGYTIQN